MTKRRPGGAGDFTCGFLPSTPGIEKRPWVTYICSMQVVLRFEKHARPSLDFQGVAVKPPVDSELLYRLGRSGQTSGPRVRSIGNGRLPGGIHPVPHNRIGGCPSGRCRVAILEDTGGKRYSIEWVGTAAPLEEGRGERYLLTLSKLDKC